jgi:hypothetical protein
MATSGTPNGGLDEIGRSAYVNHADLTLVAYTNARDSLGPASAASNLVQPAVQNAYAPIVLDGTWTSVNGDLTYQHSTVNIRGTQHPGWTATGAWSAPVTGVALVYGSILMHFYDLTSADFVPVNGSFLDVDLATII